MPYFYEMKKRPFTCLPEGLDRQNLLDVTSLNNNGWKKFLATATGEEHDCEIYADAAGKEFLGEIHAQGGQDV